MKSKYIMLTFILIALSAFGITKLVTYRANKSSCKVKTSRQNNLVLQGGIIGLCLGVGVGTALKDLLPETAVLFAAIIGATVGVIIGCIIKQRKAQ